MSSNASLVRMDPHAKRMRRRERFSRKILTTALKGLEEGRIVLVDGPERTVFGQDASDALDAEIHVHSSRFYSAVALGGTVGAGESYCRGDWTADSLTTLVRILARNRSIHTGMERGWASLSKPVDQLVHWFRRNQREGSRKNIAAHYDLGNDFFELFLDPSMMYSCAIFERPDRSLHEASLHKLETICRKLDLSPGDRVLEIGTGWGGFAIHAATRFGCHVTTTTISERQYTYAIERVRDAGLDDRIQVLKLDYRDLPSLGKRFNKLVSIEMIEAVGERFLPEYFRICSDLLEPQGAILIQVITIADALYGEYRKSVDFIQRYIFPGGFLPSVSAMMHSVAHQTDLQLVDLEDITAHYAETLRRWQDALNKRHTEFSERGYPDSLFRMWNYYFSYCRGGFLERTVGDVQMLLAKPRSNVARLARRTAQ